MSWGLLALIGVGYAWVGANYARKKDWGLCLVFVAYAIANVGFIIDLLKRK